MLFIFIITVIIVKLGCVYMGICIVIYSHIVPKYKIRFKQFTVEEIEIAL